MKYVYSWNEFKPARMPYMMDSPRSAPELNLTSGAHVMIGHLVAKKGSFIPMHHHDAEQFMVVIKGKLEVVCADSKPEYVFPGQFWFVPGGVPHSVEYVEDTEAFEIASPVRTDNFPGFLMPMTFFDKIKNPLEIRLQRKASKRK